MFKKRNKRFQEVELQIGKSTPEIIQCLFNIYLMPDSTHRVDFEHRVYELLHVIPCDDDRDFPSVDQIYFWTFRKYRHMVTFCNIELLLEDASTVWDINFSKITRDDLIEEIKEDFSRFCHEYFTWLSSNLSQGGFINFTKVQDFLGFKLAISVKTNAWRRSVE